MTFRHRLKPFLLILTIAAVLTGPASDRALPDDIQLDPANPPTQRQFNNAVRDLGVALSYVPSEPAEARGVTGFDLGLELSFPEVKDNTQYMNRVFENQNAPSSLILPKLHAAKGLPLGFDVSGFVGGEPNGNARLFGGALKYSLLEGGVITPATALRGHFTHLAGVDDIGLRTYGADLSVSKGFDVPFLLGITPYAGYSHFQIDGTDDAGLPGVSDYDTSDGRFFVGSRLSWGFFNLVFEADFSEVDIYSVRANFGF